MDCDLTEKARLLRGDIIRSLYLSKSGHPGGSLSCVEILLALYRGGVMSYDPKDPKKADRDRFVLSKGHACPALYVTLADLGFFPREDLWRLRKIDCHLQGHPDMNKTPGVDYNSGSLGQGVAVAAGMALAAKHAGASYKVYSLIGDGEMQEGIVWEAAMSAANYGLDNFTVLLDHNGCQIDGFNKDVMDVGDPVAKYKAFGFQCFSVDGHDTDAIIAALKAPVSGKPKFICCETVKGKGVSFMENVPGWHGRSVDEESYRQAIKELGVEFDG